MDAEGKEYDILKGARVTLEKSSLAIIIEYNQDNYNQICFFLADIGYKKIGSLLRYGIDPNILAENILFIKNNMSMS